MRSPETAYVLCRTEIACVCVLCRTEMCCAVLRLCMGMQCAVLRKRMARLPPSRAPLAATTRPGSTIRSVSTGHRVASYAPSVPDIA
eukprot:1579896-Rhodomonas_salina.3